MKILVVGCLIAVKRRRRIIMAAFVIFKAYVGDRLMGIGLLVCTIRIALGEVAVSKVVLS